jgi:hypothetical protein
MRPVPDDRLHETGPTGDHISVAAYDARFGNADLVERRPVGQRDVLRPLIFTHVPKTSGTALRSALTAALAPCRIVTGLDAFLMGDFTPLHTIDEAIRRNIIQRFDELPSDGDLIMGHLAYMTTAAVYPGGQHFIVLREPFTRLMSHYLYWRQYSTTELERWGCWGEAIRLSHGSFADFLADERIACQTDNIVVRMLLWPHKAIPRSGFISAADDAFLIAAASTTLSKYAYVDAIERPGFESALTEWFGRPIQYVRENVTPPMSRRTSFADLLTSEAISLLRLRTRLDEILWRSITGGEVDAELLRLRATARYGALMGESECGLRI